MARQNARRRAGVVAAAAGKVARGFAGAVRQIRVGTVLEEIFDDFGVAGFDGQHERCFALGPAGGIAVDPVFQVSARDHRAGVDHQFDGLLPVGGGAGTAS